METMDKIRKSYHFSKSDEENLAKLAEILLPISDQLAEDFYEFLAEDPRTASFFPNKAALERRKETIRDWFKLILIGPYDRKLLLRLQKIGEVHVKIKLEGHFVNASMNYIRTYCMRHLIAMVQDRVERENLLDTLNKVLDINLDVMTDSYREAELEKVFLSYRVESKLIHWAERMMQGLNLILMIGLLAMAVGLASLFATDVFSAFSGNLESGVIKALGSLLILWMLIELLHTEVELLRGEKFQVKVFVEIALVAFIRKLFVASLEKQDPITFALLLGSLLSLGLVFFLMGRK
jgi:uncharacterized membrane protein (DUF373 family)